MAGICQTWCSWCCCSRPTESICCGCNYCVECCRCPPPCLTEVPVPPPALPPVPPMPCTVPCPPPVRIVKEQVLVPVPVPVPVCSPCPSPFQFCSPNLVPSMYQPMGFPMCPSPSLMPFPTSTYPSYQLANMSCPPVAAPPCSYRLSRRCPRTIAPCIPLCGGLGDFCGIPKVLPPECCYEVDPEIELFNPCPPAYPKRLYRPGCPMVPGYQGHVPGLKIHGAGRTHGAATKDTRCIMSQWGKCCPRLPRRIYEQ